MTEELSRALVLRAQEPGWARVQPAERLPARAQEPVSARVQAQASVPGLASALASAPGPGFQPLAARPWALRPCAHT